jgi:hypothetical protein
MTLLAVALLTADAALLDLLQLPAAGTTLLM